MSLRICREITRPNPKLLQAFREIPTSIASDAMNRMQAMSGEIKALRCPVKISGPAVTVQSLPGDNLAIHHAIYAAKKGDILVIQGRGSRDIAIFGFIATEACRAVGIQGAVIDGAIRDSRQIAESNFPVFSLGTCPAGPHKGWGGDINRSISCGGVSVNPGDIVLGDDDGVVVIPRESASRVLEESLQLIAKEQSWLKALAQGTTTLELFGLNVKVEEIA